MRRTALVVLLFALAACSTSRPPAAGENAAMLRELNAAVAANPSNQPLIYMLAAYEDEARNAPAVVKWLTRLDELGWTNGLDRGSFRNTKTPEFEAVAARLVEREPLVHRAGVAFTLGHQRDLIPEGIAFDPVDDVFYVSSIYRRKIVRVDRAGHAIDFIAEGQDGMFSTLGMRIDPKRRLLWVAAPAGKSMRLYDAANEGEAILAAYDLTSGKLVKKAVTGTASSPSLLNDVALLDDGTVFVTDSKRNVVWRLAPGSDTLEQWLDGFSYTNGIVASDDQRSVYIADFRGITKASVDGSTRETLKSSALLNGIDGLTMHNGKLIGIQNTIGSPRVIRIDPASGEVEILETKNPHFGVPTTGVVAGDEYWFIANSGLDYFDGDVLNAKRVVAPVMLRMKL